MQTVNGVLNPLIAGELLHLFSPPVWHDDAIVVGTEGGLRRLRDAIDNALHTGAAAVPAMVEDGEGYWLVALKILPAQLVAMGEDGLGLPYTDSMAGECRPNATVDALATAAIQQAMKDRDGEPGCIVVKEEGER